ncbi:MAG: DUF1499 domain-containing protein [Acetobacteraceae bacterium]|nr:DUF1499 domain-containing protein [Acetobacteraceae bacterium]
MNPISALTGRGAEGIALPAPLDFRALRLPRSPNTCLAAPPGLHPSAHLAAPALPLDPDALFARIERAAAAMPRTHLLARWPDRRQAQWVARTPLMNWPDVIAAEAVAVGGGASLFLYSRSLFGWSDLGANRRRVEAWLSAIERE